MAGGGLVMVSAVVLVAAAVVVAASRGGGESKRVLTLERAFPVEERVGLEVIIAQDSARHARTLQSFAGGIVDFPVYGTSDPYVAGLYYTKVRLGSPPQEFNVLIDTGSDVLWVACSSCNDCPQNSGLGIALNFFDPAISSTVSSISCSDNICASLVQTSSAECSAEYNQCGYSLKYEDESGISGFYVNDLIYFDTILGTSLIANSSAPVVFGCSTSLFGDLTKSDRAYDGIFGFGQQGLSVISQLSSRGITPKVFSHCLKGEGNGGGILVLGEIMDSRIVYTPLVPSMPHYNLYLQSIAVNGQLLTIDPAVFTTTDKQGTMIDSGTTLAYLVEGAYDPLVIAVTASLSPYVTPIVSDGKQCYLVSTSVTELFPPVSFNFAGGASLVLRPVDYLVQMGFSDSAAMWCIGFIKVENGGTTILGAYGFLGFYLSSVAISSMLCADGNLISNLVLKDKIFVYDLAHQRIGWADYDCSLSVNVSITFGKDEFVDAGELIVSRGSSSSVPFKSTYQIMNALLLHIFLYVGCLVLL